MAVYGHYSMKLITLCGRQWPKSNPRGLVREGFILVDTDGDANPDTFLPGTSNFAAGWGPTGENNAIEVADGLGEDRERDHGRRAAARGEADRGVDGREAGVGDAVARRHSRRFSFAYSRRTPSVRSSSRSSSRPAAIARRQAWRMAFMIIPPLSS